MNRGKHVVEQVNIDGNIVKGRDYWLQPNELYSVFKTYFPNVEKDDVDSKYIKCSANGKRFLIRTKNVTYLGNTHKKYKKRIQLSDDIRDFYAYAKREKYIPLVIGVYTYGKLTLFVDFCIDTYINNELHNSSAHVYSTDLQQVLLPDEESDEDENYGYYEKVDYFGNRVTVFDVNSVSYFLEKRSYKSKAIEDYLRQLKTAAKKEKKVVGRERNVDIAIEYDTDRVRSYGNKVLPDRTKNIVLNYFEKIQKKWLGIDCYKEMLTADYRNKNQAEWPGFYLEYSFEKYLTTNGYDNVRFAQEKEDGGIDLDLYFADKDVYGDLKAHSEEKKDIPGNKTETIERVLKEKGEVIYVVCVHKTEKDAEHCLEVTHYWNDNKTNKKKNQKRDSYAKRMKHSIDLLRVEILSINADNVMYLKGFTQGKNSNGKPRKVKVMIDDEHISKFRRLIYPYNKKGC